MDFGLGAHGDGNLGMVFGGSQAPNMNLSSQATSPNNKKKSMAQWAANLDTISTLLNHLNIFIMGSCSNQKEDSYDSLRDADESQPEIVEDLYSIDFPGTAVRIPGNWTRLDAAPILETKHVYMYINT